MRTIKTYIELYTLTDNMTNEECVAISKLPEYDLEIEYTFTPGQDAKIYGEPENCHPEEPAEIEFNLSSEDMAENVCREINLQLPINFVTSDGFLKLKHNIMDTIDHYLNNQALNDVFDNERAINDY